MGLCYGRRGTRKLELLVIIVLIHGPLRGDTASNSFSRELQSCICPGDTITYNCTIVAENSTVTSWSGTAINAAIMEYSCEYNVIDLLHTRFYENVSITCGSKALVAQSIGVAMSPSNSCFTSELILKAFLGLDGKAIDCSLSAGFKEVGQSSVMIAGPQSTPDSVSVNFSDDVMMHQFTIVWNSGPNISCSPTECYAIDVSGTDAFCGGLEFVNVSTTSYQCSNWPRSLLGQNYTFRVATVNCGTQMGDYSGSVKVHLQVPDAVPTFSAVTSLYDTNGLNLNSTANTVLNEVTVATLPNGTEVQIPVRRYRFTYTFDDSPSIPPQSDYVLSGECGDNTCTSMITLDIPARSQRLRVSVAAENVIGVGESSSLTVSICVPQELGKGNVSTVDGNCYHDLTTRFFVRIAAGRACFNNITDNSMAVYSCNCDGNYTLSDPTMSNRTCQNGGWSGEIPQCIPNCESVTFPAPFEGNLTKVSMVSRRMDIECIATYECVNASFVMRGNDTIVFNPETCSWGDPPFCIQSQGGGGGGLNAGEIVGIVIGAVTFLVVLVLLVLLLCCILRRRRKASAL